MNQIKYLVIACTPAVSGGNWAAVTAWIQVPAQGADANVLLGTSAQAVEFILTFTSIVPAVSSASSADGTDSSGLNGVTTGESAMIGDANGSAAGSKNSKSDGFRRGGTVEDGTCVVTTGGESATGEYLKALVNEGIGEPRPKPIQPLPEGCMAKGLSPKRESFTSGRLREAGVML